MNMLDNRRTAFGIAGALAFAVGMLALPVGLASANGGIGGGILDLCFDYDNTNPQAAGLFTDLRRPTEINVVPDGANCVLNFTGSTGSAGDMWITMVDPPGPFAFPPFNCLPMEAEFNIHRFDNRKGVGFVTHYDPIGKTGLFVGLYDNGNTDALTLSTFDGATGKLTGTVATKALGSKIQENVWYYMHTEVCVIGGNLAGGAAVEISPGVVEALPFSGQLPSGILPAGQVGIAGQAKSSFVDSSVRNVVMGAGGG